MLSHVGDERQYQTLLKWLFPAKNAQNWPIFCEKIFDTLFPQGISLKLNEQTSWYRAYFKARYPYFWFLRALNEFTTTSWQTLPRYEAYSKQMKNRRFWRATTSRLLKTVRSAWKTHIWCILYINVYLTSARSFKCVAVTFYEIQLKIVSISANFELPEKNKPFFKEMFWPNQAQQG